MVPVDAVDPSGDVETPSEPPRHPRPWYRRPRVVVGLVLCGAAAGGAVAFGIAWSHRGAQEASTDQAVEEFRQRHDAAGSSFLRPASGVYTYVGTGTEKLSLLATTQQWGPEIPVTVTGEADGCWAFRIDYSTNHWQSSRFCPAGRVLKQTGETTFQSFDFVAVNVSDTNETVCDPPIDRVRVDARPGDSWTATCTGRSPSRNTEFAATGTDTFVGVESVTVAGEDVAAYHYRVERSVSGSQTGSEHYDMWFSALDGLPVKTERSVEVHSPSPIGTVTYTEQGSFTLDSITPRR